MSQLRKSSSAASQPCKTNRIKCLRSLWFWRRVSAAQSVTYGRQGRTGRFPQLTIGPELCVERQQPFTAAANLWARMNAVIIRPSMCVISRRLTVLPPRETAPVNTSRASEARPRSSRPPSIQKSTSRGGDPAAARGFRARPEKSLSGPRSLSTSSTQRGRTCSVPPR